jgi:hypothetical protein
MSMGRSQVESGIQKFRTLKSRKGKKRLWIGRGDGAGEEWGPGLGIAGRKVFINEEGETTCASSAGRSTR